MRIVFVLFFVFIIIFSLYPEDVDEEVEGVDVRRELYHEGGFAPLFYGKLGYSFLMDGNIVLGLELALDYRYPWEWEWITVDHVIGIDYQYIFKSNESLLRLTYIKTFMIIGGAGISLSYNVDTNEFGIAPQIGINNYFWYIFAVNTNYRYNIILNNMDRNFHEIVLSLSILLPIEIDF